MNRNAAPIMKRVSTWMIVSLLSLLQIFKIQTKQVLAQDYTQWLKEGNIVKLNLARLRPHRHRLCRLRPHRLRLSRLRTPRLRLSRLCHSRELGWGVQRNYILFSLNRKKLGIKSIGNPHPHSSKTKPLPSKTTLLKNCHSRSFINYIYLSVFNEKHDIIKLVPIR